MCVVATSYLQRQITMWHPETLGVKLWLILFCAAILKSSTATCRHATLRATKMLFDCLSHGSLNSTVKFYFSQLQVDGSAAKLVIH